MEIPGEEIPKMFMCSTCDMTFSTHQALGGHKASHRKRTLVVYNTNEHRSTHQVQKKNKHNISPANSNVTNELGSSSSTTASDERAANPTMVFDLNTCGFCNKSFNTRQGLGVHKTRCHSIDDRFVQVQTVRKGLDIDLNKMPELEDDDNEHSSSRDTSNIHVMGLYDAIDKPTIVAQSQDPTHE